MATNKQLAFTLVELLIVILVIGILSAITIVAYNGIQNLAQEARVQSDVSQMVKKVQIFAVSNADMYPTSITSCHDTVPSAVCYEGSDDLTVTYAVDNSVTPKSFCFSTTISNGTSYYSDENGKVLPGNCAKQSCYAIQQSGGSRGSGTYWIQPTGVVSPIRVYCDMDTSGGGWTLLVTNPGPASTWNSTKVLSVNPNNPSISEQYSILNKANDIKANLGGKLRYRIDATSFGRLGGVWEAPYSSSFVATASPMTATNIEQYDAGSWTIDTDMSNGTSSPSNLMPYIMDSTRILTTTNSTSSWWGTLVSNSGSFSPAPWIGNPGIIWYWVR